MSYWIVYLNRFGRYECVAVAGSAKAAKERCQSFKEFHPNTDYMVVKTEFVPCNDTK